jgi:hypothetical protein
MCVLRRQSLFYGKIWTIIPVQMDIEWGGDLCYRPRRIINLLRTKQSQQEDDTKIY